MEVAALFEEAGEFLSVEVGLLLRVGLRVSFEALIIESIVLTVDLG